VGRAEDERDGESVRKEERRVGIRLWGSREWDQASGQE
jgi:hypothetical protein